MLTFFNFFEIDNNAYFADWAKLWLFATNWAIETRVAAWPN